MSVVLGTHNLKEAGRTMTPIVKKCKHPSFENVEKGYDIMLLKVSRFSYNLVISHDMLHFLIKLYPFNFCKNTFSSINQYKN